MPAGAFRRFCWDRPGRKSRPAGVCPGAGERGVPAASPGAGSTARRGDLDERDACLSFLPVPRMRTQGAARDGGGSNGVRIDPARRIELLVAAAAQAEARRAGRRGNSDGCRGPSRTADADETAPRCTVLEHAYLPAGLFLTRQDLPSWTATEGKAGMAHPPTGCPAAGHLLAEMSGGRPRVALLATGGDIPIALEARTILSGEVRTRDDDGHAKRLFCTSVKPVDRRGGQRARPGRLMVRRGEAVSTEGAPAPFWVLHEQFGLTAPHVAATARSGLGRGTRSGPPSGLPFRAPLPGRGHLRRGLTPAGHPRSSADGRSHREYRW